MAKTTDLPGSWLPDGVVVRGAMLPAYETRSDAGGDRLCRRARAQIRRRAPAAPGPPRRASSSGSTPAGSPISRPRPTRSATAIGRWRRCPRDLLDRRVEITGPVDRKMVINALNSGASVYMADFEDANTPTWDNLIEGQVNLLRRGAPHHHLRRSAKPAGITRSTTRPRRLLVRPRGWHLPRRMCSSMARRCRARCSISGFISSTTRRNWWRAAPAPISICRRWKASIEARLWNDVFVESAGALGHAQRHDQGDGADRDDPGRLRDGRDPVRAQGPFGRAQLRAMGLHLQLHQEIRRGPGLRDARPRRR